MVLGGRVSWEQLLVAAWGFVMACNGLISWYPHVMWLVTALTLVPVWLLRKHQNAAPVDVCSIVGPVLILAGVVLTLFTGHTFGETLKQGTELSLILLGGIIWLMREKTMAAAAFWGIAGAAFANAALVVLGLCGASWAAGIMATFRWGTLLNLPGELMLPGMAILTYAVYMFAVTRKLPYALMIATGLLLVFADGAREGLLGVGVLVVVAVVAAWRDSGPRAAASGLVLTMVLFAIGLEVAPSSQRATQTIQQTKVVLEDSSSSVSKASLGTSSGTSSLSVLGEGSGGLTRIVMVEAAVADILRHPLYGTGIGTTTAVTVDGVQVVHDAYLQMWGDCGPLAFAGIILTVFSWLIGFRRRWRNIGKASLPWRGLQVGAIGTLLFFGMSALLTPISTQWSMWGPLFLVPLALVTATPSVSEQDDA